MQLDDENVRGEENRNKQDHVLNSLKIQNEQISEEHANLEN